MNAEQFLQLINRYEAPEKKDILEAKKLQEVFPYFVIPHIVSAAYETKKTPGKTSTSLGAAAINSSDRVWLKHILEIATVKKVTPKVDVPKAQNTESNGSDLKNKELVKSNEEIKETTPPKETPKRIRRKSKGDELIENIRKREKKEIQDEKKKEQINLIREFSKKSIKLAALKEIESNQNKENLAESSTKFNSNAISESLAAMLVKQGKPELAKEIYEKLLLKFPDKSTYFADLIEKLKE